MIRSTCSHRYLINRENLSDSASIYNSNVSCWSRDSKQKKEKEMTNSLLLKHYNNNPHHLRHHLLCVSRKKHKTAAAAAAVVVCQESYPPSNSVHLRLAASSISQQVQSLIHKTRSLNFLAHSPEGKTITNQSLQLKIFKNNTNH